MKGLRELEESRPGERIRFRRPGRKERWLRRLVARPTRDAVVVMGNQKSGTTAIAALLSHYAGLKATLDFYPYLGPDDIALAHSGPRGFRRFVRRFRWELSAELIKEPMLTFLAEPMRARFPQAHFVWIVRDPRDNIRSILNRLGIAGNLERIPPDAEILPVWRAVLDNEGLGLPSGTYIERLAHRWRLAAEHAVAVPGELVRYEDFVQDREGSIRALAQRLGLRQVNPVAHLVDRQFQDRGNRTVSWEAFFGAANLRAIEDICGPLLERLDYPRTGFRP